MSIEETKNQIVAGLNNNSIQLLVQRLAEILVENEALKAKIATFEKSAVIPPNPA